MSIIQILNYAFPLITIPLVSRILGVDKIGLINYIFAFSAYFILIVNYGFNYTAIRRSNSEGVNKAFSLIVTTQFYLLMLASILFCILVFFIYDLRNNLTLFIFSFIMCISVFFNKNWVFQIKSDLYLIVLIDFFSKLISMVLIVMFVRNQEDYIFYGFVLSIVQLLGSIVSFYISKNKYQLIFKISTVKEVYRCLKEDKELFFSSVVINIYTTTSVVLLGYFTTNKDVGLYTSAQKIIELARNVGVSPIFQVYFPIVAFNFSKNKSEGIEYVKKIMPIFILLSLFFLLCLYLFGALAINILFGEKFHDSIFILYILSVGFFFQILSMIFGLFLMMNLNMDKPFLKQQIGVSILSFITLIVILPYGKSITVAIMWVACEILVALLQYRYLKKSGYIVLEKKMLNRKSLIDGFRVFINR